MKRINELFYEILSGKKFYKIVTETNKVKFKYAKNKSALRLDLYQLYGSENFTITRI